MVFDAYNFGMKDICLPNKIYMVGIGGVSMSGIAQYLHALGRCVCGSDKVQNDYTQKLQRLGIDVQSESNSIEGVDSVIRTSAVKDDHPQIVQARKLGIPVVLREQVLGTIFDSFDVRIAICGTHGKTTVTALLHHVLQKCGVGHTAFIGGSYQGNNYFGGGKIVVAEACEYNRSFLHLHPTHTLCLNVEYDHPDCYHTFDDVQQAFVNLFEQSQKVITSRKLPFKYTKSMFYDDFCAKNVYTTNKNTTFDVYRKSQFVGKCNLPLVGEHNISNALAVVSLCQLLKLPLLQVLHAFSTFEGVGRRWTEVPYKCKVICDYAHHPTEITATIQTAKSLTKGKVFCIFQPHTYTRTQAFWQQFATCFDGTTVFYLPIFPAREEAIFGVTSKNLRDFATSIGIDAHYCDTFLDAKKFVEQHVTSNDTLLILGAGDVVNLAQLLTI